MRGCEPEPYCCRLARLSVSPPPTDSLLTESPCTTASVSASVPSRQPSPLFYCGPRSEPGGRSATKFVDQCLQLEGGSGPFDRRGAMPTRDNFLPGVQRDLGRGKEDDAEKRTHLVRSRRFPQ